LAKVGKSKTFQVSRTQKVYCIPCGFFIVVAVAVAVGVDVRVGVAADVAVGGALVAVGGTLVAVGGALVAVGGALVAVGGAPHRDPRHRRRAHVHGTFAARGKSRSGGAYARAPRAIVLFARTAWQSRAPARKANGGAGASAGSR